MCQLWLKFAEFLKRACHGRNSDHLKPKAYNLIESINKSI